MSLSKQVLTACASGILLTIGSITQLKPSIGQEPSHTQSNDPIEVALNAVREQGGAGGKRREIRAENDSLENPQRSTVTITGEGLADDSVRGYRFRLQLQKDAEGNWTVTDVQKSWVCQPGRGSQEYTQALCS